eukprot:TRINITY_DN4764_c0_g2_i1.p1 TRINITY_DN4764_c0_g2~~TRINITY_DN4764_c0_g2_i1.p1  ORF type:complete len:753 (+),score=267.95 TRINITY_DN4764_c0_g2_i1:87-2345(+)
MAASVDELAPLLLDYRSAHGGKSSSSATKAPVAAPAPAAAAPAAAAAAAPAGDGDWRFSLLRSVGEECQTEAELTSLLQRKAEFRLYDGFEPSGRMHIAQGVFKAVNVNKCTKAGGIFIFWVADWFALMNDKMGGDLEKIKTVGKYLIEVWKAAGMDMTRVKFLWSSDEICNHAKQYWLQALDIARRSTLSRIKKCGQIMGRKEDGLTAAQILYPIMQCTDVFFLKADICQLGVDQRKVNMLARDYCDLAGIAHKPVILSHHMLYGLKAGQAKMSKSDPDSAIFMEDSAADVERKIKQAYCPTKPEEVSKVAEEESMQLVEDTLKNPCLDYCKNIVFPAGGDGYVFKAGMKSFSDFESLKEAFIAGQVSEADLKATLIAEVNKLLEPVRQHFQKDANAKELLAKITQWKKENLAVVSSSLTRLDKVVDAKGGPVYAVFAPLPTETIRLESVLGVLSRLQQAPKGTQRILWLEDWTAFTLSRVSGNAACIKGFYELLLAACRSLAPALMKDVRVCWQEEMILLAPSEYWISVINAGRKCSVERIREQMPAGESLEQSSQVVASLMHIGDVFALRGSKATTLACDGYHENLHALAKELCESSGLGAPEIVKGDMPALRLQPEGEVVGVEADVNVMLTDKDLDVNRKIKKAFCQGGNVESCPPLFWAGELMKLTGAPLEITRKPDNGGDKSYTEAKPLKEDFASGALHPGDLKPAVSKMVNKVLETLRAELKSSDVLKKAQKDLENLLKASAKKK